ncbi:hypothetical protein PBCVNEJV4_274R [Paramecium bursaria Chlorella virus NE-JV-4]|uniref:Uncharacterized protein n=1 Tax=Paramecium bursaria Chlorella virus IL3A TaxID=46019 RepID=M1HPN0_PBCVI|nr:hypothetical protein PBCVIL3A_261R [Paramecium bursaria Chlorella virus IL3A]AGE57269.1 hypothetical protein PBCVNEJV4_274R [Paramecium bursaria Chlorella virus NE-JV-4]
MPIKCSCGRCANYGLPGEKTRWCGGCKPKDAVDITHKKCPCRKARPSFGLLGGKAVWCKECKPTDAVNVVNKKCPCGKTPHFGLPGEKTRWCKDCKPINAVDITHKKCPCGKNPKFGIPGQKAEFCNDCKPETAVNVVHKKCKCGKIPIFGLIDGKAEWCSDCKPDDAFDVINKMCPGYDGVPCPVRTQLKQGKTYCLSCDPDTSRRLPRKKDEHAFFCFIKKHGINITQREYRIDYRCIDTSKSHAFIDGIIITPNIVICIEVDEDAHKSYECDEARTNFASTELLLAFPEHHIAWIRVNPTIGNFDRSDKALKIRDERYFEAVLSIRKFLERPTTDIVYIGYE